jgi:AraC family transcriptional regulator
MTLHEIAADLDVHPARLSSEFRRYTGRSVGDYLRDLRVGFVKERLRHQDTPLAEIATGAGFADQAHCTRVFKAVTGWTPGKFRVALRAGSIGARDAGRLGERPSNGRVASR